jgi:hypothetical protein
MKFWFKKLRGQNQFGGIAVGPRWDTIQMYLREIGLNM